MQDAEIKVAFAELVALFGYGHTALWLTGWQYNSTTNFLQLPYNLYWFEDGIFIQGVHKDYKESIGAQVIKIENMPRASLPEQFNNSCKFTRNLDYVQV